MESPVTTNSRSWPIVLAAAAIMMITMGIRQSLGLYVAPINTSTGLGIVAISFAMAVGQFVWGAVQPIFGVLADRYGTERILIVGAILLAAGLGLTTGLHRRSVCVRFHSGQRAHRKSV